MHMRAHFHVYALLYLTIAASATSLNNTNEDLIYDGFQSSTLFTSSLVPRQTRQCVNPGYIPCFNGNFCCPGGYTCQPNNPRGAGIGWCCPPGGLQCGGGRDCCKTGLAFCCGASCCPIGFTCNGGQCLEPTRPTVPISRPPTFSIATASRTTCAIGFGNARRQDPGDCDPALPTRVTVRPSSTPVETRIPVATMRFDYDRLKTGKRKLSAAKQQKREKAVDELFESMCKGLKNRGKEDSDIFTFTDDEAVKSKNRANAGCTGSPCSTGATGTSCDEFPFASTEDGGVGAVFSCIDVLAQNIQGGVISSFKQRNNMQTGMHYKFEILNYICPGSSASALAVEPILNKTLSFGVEGSELEELQRRDLAPGGSLSESEAFPPLDEADTNNVVIMSVGDLPAGVYSISARILSGQVTSIRVIDNQGQEYVRANATQQTDGQRTLVFNLLNQGVGLGLFLETQLELVNVTSTLQTGAVASVAVRLGGMPEGLLWKLAGILTILASAMQL